MFAVFLLTISSPLPFYETPAVTLLKSISTVASLTGWFSTRTCTCTDIDTFCGFNNIDSLSLVHFERVINK